MFYVYDLATHLHFVWTMKNKSEAALLECYQELCAFIKSLGRDLVIFSSDNDKATGMKFRSCIRADHTS